MTLPKRSTGSEVVRKRLPSLDTQCGSMRWAMKSMPMHSATAPTVHSTVDMSHASVPARRRDVTDGHEIVVSAAPASNLR